MKTLYSLLSMSLMVSLTSTAYAQAPSYSVNCEPAYLFPDNGYQMGVYNLEIGSINYGSENADTDGGYRSNPTFVFELNPSTQYNIAVSTGAFFGENVRVYIDYNGNGDFSEDELIFTSTGIQNHTGNFTTPAFASENNVWIRVMSDWDGSPEITNSCQNLEGGQAEDFVANLTVPITPSCPMDTQVTCEPTTSFQDIEYGEGVLGIQIGTTSFSSGTAVEDGGYKANPCSEFTLEASTEYSITITTGSEYNEDVYVYIDYNNDGDFEDNGELVFTSFNKLQTHSGTFTTPNFITQQKVWIRVKSDDADFGFDGPGPCSASNYGQNEDFVANLIPSESSNDDGPTFVVDKFCGTTLQMSTTFSAKAVSGAEIYEFELTSLSSTSVISVQRPGRNARLNLFQGITYNTTYSARVRAYVNGEWTNFGPSCIISSPDYPTVELNSKFCETTLEKISTNFLCTSAFLATDFEWEFTSQTDASVINAIKGSDLRTMNGKTAGLLYNTTYSVRVRPYIEGEWRAYGPSCNITTPDYPTTAVLDKFCGTTLSKMNSNISCSLADRATNYEWEFTSLSDASVITKVKGSDKRTMNPNEAGLAQGTTYSVRVRPYIEGDWRAYGSNCLITTPGVAARGINEEDSDEIVEVEKISDANTEDMALIKLSTSMNVFPSPAKSGQQVSIVVNNFNKNDSKVTLMVTDLLGKRVVMKEVNNTDGNIREYLNFDSNLTTGIYIVTLVGSSENISSKLIIE
jgi:hypothetical protein